MSPVAADQDVSRPTFQSQLPNSVCSISGKLLGSVSCSAYGMAMGIDQATYGKRRPTGCSVRSHTVPLDTTGGLTLSQVAAVAEREHGVEVELRVGSNVASTKLVAAHLRGGAGVNAQINTRPLLSHPGYRSTGTAINHDIHLCSARGGTWYDPDEVLVFDPAANGRRAGWGKAAQGPQWWPWELFLACAAALRPWGEDDPRTLGAGRVYAGLIEPPDVTLRFGARRTTPFPDRARIKVRAGRKANVRSRPDKLGAQYIVDHKTNGELFVAYQVTSGVLVGGSRRWYGNRSATRWLPAARLAYEGGDT